MSHKRLEDAGYRRDKFGNWVKVGGECLNSHREPPKGATGRGVSGATGHKVSKELNATGREVSGAVGHKVSGSVDNSLDTTSQPSIKDNKSRKRGCKSIKVKRVEID